MAKPVVSFATLFALFLFFIIFTASDLHMAEAKLCQRQSKTWTGWCGDTTHCDNQCKTWEAADHGACHYQFPGMCCFCYFNC
ncbi:hypothetical protein ACHQM5_023137 [Ranunculus cassubicifolius]